MRVSVSEFNNAVVDEPAKLGEELRSFNDLSSYRETFDSTE